jgi:hypothetical protein
VRANGHQGALPAQVLVQLVLGKRADVITSVTDVTCDMLRDVGLECVACGTDSGAASVLQSVII